MCPCDTEHEKVAAAISKATGIPKEAIFSSEVVGVMGVVAALYAWQHERDLLRLAKRELRKHRVIVPCMEGNLFVGEIETLPGVVAYGATEEEAREKTRALGLAVLVDRFRHEEEP